MDKFSKWPGIILAIGIVAGITASMVTPTIAIGTATVALAAAIVLRRRTTAILCGGVLLGAVSGLLQRPATLADSGIGSKGIFTATVENATANNNYQRILVTVNAPRPFKAELRTSGCDYTLLPGEIIEFHADFRPTPDVNTILTSDTNSSNLHLLSEGAGATARIDGIRSLGFDNGLKHRAGRLARRMVDVIYDTGFSPATSALLAGAFFGGDYADAGTRSTFRAAGVAHLLCISGFHVALIAALLGFIMYPLRAGPRLMNLRRTLILCGVWAYATISGLQPSAVRAATMLTVLTVALAADRTHNSPNALGITLALMLAAVPYWLFSIGFQLSAAAVAGLMCFFAKLNPVSPRRRVLLQLSGICVAPVAALAGIFPLLLLYFHNVPLAGFLSGIAGAILFPLFMLSGGVTALLGTVGLAPRFMTSATDAVADMLEAVCRYTASLTWNTHTALYPSAETALLILGAVIMLGVLVHRDSRRARIATGAAAVVLAAAAVAFAYVPENI